MTMIVGASDGNKAVNRLVVGTTDGNKDVLAGYVGTAEGNKVFYASTFDVTVTRTIDWGPAEGEGGTIYYFAVYAADISGGTPPFTVEWFPSGGVMVDGQGGSEVILWSFELPSSGSVYCIVTDDNGVTSVSNSAAY